MCNVEITNILGSKPLRDPVDHTCDTGRQRAHWQPDRIAGEYLNQRNVEQPKYIERGNSQDI